jgi:drug/metabolite transporter (DMT)-like permease
MLAMTGASVVFVFSDVLTKLATGHWPVAQVLVVRGVVAIAISLALVIFMGEGRKIPMIGRPLLLLRAVVEASVAVLFITALSKMPLADLTSILMLSPLVITALAIVFFGDQVGWRRWAAIVVGFFGLLMVVQPGGARADAPEYLFSAGLGLASVVAVAFRDLITRRIDRDIPSIIITLSTACGSCLAGVVLSAFEVWRPIASTPLLACFVAAFILTAGNFLVILACRGVDLSAVAPFRYSSVIWAIGLGYFVFGDLPNRLALAGMAVIVASGIYLMHRERVRMREKAAR